MKAKKKYLYKFPNHKFLYEVLKDIYNSMSLYTSMLVDDKESIKKIRLSKKYGCQIPRAILIDPTSACNLQCKGCWAAGYKKQDSLSYDTLDRIITQGKELGIKYYFFSGGEPLVRKDDLLILAEKHNNVLFAAFTNATLIDENFADKVAKLKNFTFFISIEGFREDTDYRRGKGTYDNVIKAMDILKERNIEFAFSACYHSQNYKSILSDEFVEFMIEKGCKLGWLFNYVPVGKKAPMELVCNPEQRGYIVTRLQELREKLDISFIDFFNDAHLVGGCVSAGRLYAHINARGDMEPCAFVHYSDSNIHDMSLLDALRSPLFKGITKNQPFNDNPLRSCPLIDNPTKLKNIVNSTDAKSTDLVSPEHIDEHEEKMVRVANQWGEFADKLYQSYQRKTKRMFNLLKCTYRILNKGRD